MKLIYKIDKKYDEEIVHEFMPKGGKKNRQGLADLLRIDIEELEKVLEDKNATLEKAVNILVNSKYSNLLPYLQNSVYDYQKSWDKINDIFFELVSLKTGQPWKYKKYYCIVSAYHEGISSWGKDIIARRWSVNADVQRKVTAHELALSHFWTMLENNATSKRWPDNKKWQYSEIFSWCLLGLDKDFNVFWPWLLKAHLFPTNHQYHNLIPLQNKLKDMYLESDNFTSFFEHAIRTNKKDA